MTAAIAARGSGGSRYRAARPLRPRARRGRGRLPTRRARRRSIPMSSTTSNGISGGPDGHDQPGGASRRDFLGLVTAAFAAVGTAAFAWTLIASMTPAADVIAAGAPMDLD